MRGRRSRRCGSTPRAPGNRSRGWSSARRRALRAMRECSAFLPRTPVYECGARRAKGKLCALLVNDHDEHVRGEVGIRLEAVFLGALAALGGEIAEDLLDARTAAGEPIIHFLLESREVRFETFENLHLVHGAAAD